MDEGLHNRGAEVEIPKGGAEGMIVTEGGRFGGYGLFLSKGVAGIRQGKVVFLYNLLDLKRTVWEGPELRAGQAHHSCSTSRCRPRLRQRWHGRVVRGRQGSSQENDGKHDIPVDVPGRRGRSTSVEDTRTGVAMIEYRYDCPFKFTGKIDKLTFNLGPAQYTAEYRKQLPAIAEQNRASAKGLAKDAG